MVELSVPAHRRADRWITRSSGSRDLATVLALLALTVVVYGWDIWSNRAPIIFSDEAGTLGNARWLAGGTLWSMGASSASNIGYPLLIAPIFWLVESPDLIYRLVLLTNVVLAAAMVGVLYLLARRGLGAGHWAALAAAACGGAYPAVAVQVGVAWVEVTAMAGIAVFVLTAILAAKKLSPGTIVVHAVVAGYLYSLHGRFTAIPILTFVGLVVVAVLRPRLRWWSIGSAVTMVGLAVGLSRLENAALLARWGVPGRPELGLRSIISALPWSELRSFAAQGWYLIAGTAGLVVVGTAAIVRAVALRGVGETEHRQRVSGGSVAVGDGEDVRHPDAGPDHEAARPVATDGDDESVAMLVPATAPQPASGVGGRALAIYLALALSSVFVISVTYMAVYLTGFPTLARVDQIYYGRYNECLIPVLICAAVGAVLDPRRRRLAVIGLGTSVILGPLLLAVSFAARGDLPFTGSINPYMLSALQPMFGLTATNMAVGPGFVIPAAIVAAGATLLLAVLTAKARWVVPLLVVAAFATVAVVDDQRISVRSDLASSQVQVYDQLRSLNPQTVAYDPKTVGVYAFYAMQFWLNESTFTPYDSATAQWPQADMYIGPAKWPAGTAHGLKVVLVEKLSGKGFYVPS